jgi:hypothetical protein
VTLHWNLYAVGCCWSLRRSWANLGNANTTSRDDDLPGVRSVAVGVVGRTSGHSDPAAVAVLDRARTGTHYTRTIDTAREAITEAHWLTRSALRTQQPTPGPVLVQLGHALAQVDADTARDVAAHLQQADAAVRRHLRIGPDHRPLDTNPPCPAPRCGQRLLRLWTSGPQDRWSVLCTAPRKPQVVPHIWAGDQAAELLKNGTAA